MLFSFLDINWLKCYESGFMYVTDVCSSRTISRQTGHFVLSSSISIELWEEFLGQPASPASDSDC